MNPSALPNELPYNWTLAYEGMLNTIDLISQIDPFPFFRNKKIIFTLQPVVLVEVSLVKSDGQLTVIDWDWETVLNFTREIKAKATRHEYWKYVLTSNKNQLVFMKKKSYLSNF